MTTSTANVVEFPTGRVIDLGDDDDVAEALDADILPMYVVDAVRTADASHVLDERYEVGDVIGRGATSIVCRGRDRQFQCDVAIKLLHPPDDKLGELVMRATIGEARTVRRLNSPHVVRVHDAGIDGLPYIVMDLEIANDGTCAAAALSDECYLPRDLEEAMGWVRDAALGVAAAHGLGVYHYDIKPQNLLIEPVNRRAKLIDFGIGSMLDGIGGTPAYMAPEHARALRDHAAVERLDRYKLDVFGLGALTYHLVYDETVTMPTGTRDEQLTIVGDARPTVSRETPTRWGYGAGRATRIIRRAISHDPADRYASATDLASDIDAWLESKPLLEEKTRYPTRFKLWCYRVRAPLAAVGVSVAGLVALGIISTILWNDVNSASAKLGLVTQQVEDKQHELTARDEENMRLRDTLYKRDEQTQALTDKVAALDTHSQELDKQLGATSIALTNTERERDQARSEARTTKAILAVTNEKLRQTEETLGTTKEILGRTERDLGETKKAHGQTKEKLASAQRDIETSKSTLETIKSTLETAKTELSAKHTALQKSEGENKRLSDQNEQLRKQIEKDAQPKAETTKPGSQELKSELVGTDE